MSEINLDGIFEQTSEEVTEEVVEETLDSEEILDEQTSEDEIIEEESDEEVEEVEEEVDGEPERDLKSIEIKFKDDPIKSLGDYTNEEIQKYHQLGLKSTEEITKAKETVQDFNKVAEMYDISVGQLLEQLENQIFESRSQEPGGQDEGRHVDDIRKEYKTNNKNFIEKSISNLLDAYPDLTADTIPKEVLEEVKYGRDIERLYTDHLMKEENSNLKTEVEKLQKEMKVLKQNKQSKSKAFIKGGSGSTKSTGSTLLNEIDKILS